MTPDPSLFADFRAGRRFALARAISLVENERPGFEALLHELYPAVGSAHRIGITGPPGAGKSTLTARLTAAYRAAEERVGVVAVDPSSPFTGGALLGDRIRMTEVSTDAGVFIRSMASRGALGGLALGSREVADVMDAFGFGRIITETVGVGQSELEIATMADTTVVVLVPESGDSIQAMKAGLMEVADIFVINKADRPGADRLARELEMMLHLRLGEAPGGAGHHGVGGAKDGRPPTAGHHGAGSAGAHSASTADHQAQGPGRPGDHSGSAEHHRPGVAVGPAAREGARERVASEGGWAVPVLQTIAESGGGLDALTETLDRHRVYLQESGELERRRADRLEERVRRLVDREIRRRVWREGPGEAMLAEALADLGGGTSPYTVADRIASAVLPRAAEPPAR